MNKCSSSGEILAVSDHLRQPVTTYLPVGMHSLKCSSVFDQLKDDHNEVVLVHLTTETLGRRR